MLFWKKLIEENWWAVFGRFPPDYCSWQDNGHLPKVEGLFGAHYSSISGLTILSMQ